MTDRDKMIIEKVKNLLHSAYTWGYNRTNSRDYDKWVTDSLSALEPSLEDAANPTDSDTKDCKVCGGRTALIHGSFYYEPDSEPYMSGIEEETKCETGECWVGAFKCDDCDNIQDLWTE